MKIKTCSDLHRLSTFGEGFASRVCKTAYMHIISVYVRDIFDSRFLALVARDMAAVLRNDSISQQ